MAIAPSPFFCGKDLLDLLRQTDRGQERSVEAYRRLLAINHLAVLMNAAKEVEHLRGHLAEFFQEWMPQESVRLCIVNEASYCRTRLSGPAIAAEEGTFPLSKGVLEEIIRSGKPLWIPDAFSSKHAARLTVRTANFLPRSIMILPFSAGEKFAGALEMFSGRPDRFDEIEYHMGVLLTSHISCSLENLLTKQELAAANARLRDHEQKLTQLNQQLRQLANTDEVTGLFNKRRLFEQLDAEIARVRRYGEILSCLMLDIDHFKKINDHYGHQAGDEVLSRIGELLKRSLRVTDFVARYGGEEFTVLLPRTDVAGACHVAENLRKKIKSTEFTIAGSRVRLTVSIGIAHCTKFDRLDSQQVILHADNALYRAKRSGRDMVCNFQETNP